jgi:hypothetical protein
MGGITIRLDPALIRRVGLTMAGPAASPEPLQALATHPLVVELEQRSHYSRRSLQYAFKARFGCGPMQYLRRQRLWLARRRLEEPGPECSVGSIASVCGYLSLASFSRDFQRCFGIPPSSLLAQRQRFRRGK